MSLHLGSLAHVTLFLVGIFALFHFVLVPRAHRAAQQAGVEARPGAAAWYAAAEFLRSATLVMALGAVLTVLAFILSSAFVDYLGADSLASIKRGLTVVRGWREAIAAMNPFYSALVLAAVVFAFTVLAWRGSTRKVSESRKRAWQAEFERVMKAKQAGEWDERPPTELMQSIAKEINGRIEFLAIAEQLEQAMQTNNQEMLSKFNPLPTPVQLKESKERVTNEVARLHLQHEMLDAERRMTVDSLTPELEIGAPKNFRERILTFFASRGLLNLLSVGRRALLSVTLLLLIPGHLALTAPSLDGLLAARELRLNDAAITLNAEVATQSWEQTFAASAVPDPQPLTEEDEQAIQGTAQAFEQALVRSNPIQLARTLRTGVETEARRFATVRGDQARRDVISTIEQRRGLVADTNRAAESMPPLHREVMQFEATVNGTESPRTPLYKLAERDLRDAAMRSPTFREHLKSAWAGHTQSFQQIDSHSQLTARLISNLLAPGADIGTQFGGEIAELSHVFEDAAGSAFRARAYKAQMSSFMSSLNSTSNLDTAVASVVHSGSDGLIYTRSEIGKMQAVVTKVPDEETIVRAYQQHADRGPPSFRDAPPPVPGATPGVPPGPRGPGGGAARAEQILKEYAAKTYVGRSLPEDFGNALASYADYFPAHSGEAAATRMASARIAASEVSAIGGQIAAQAAGQAMAKSIASEGAKLAHMSRSYVKLAGFRRVGGVLIGREPAKNDSALDFRDLSWSIEAGNVRLALTRGDGRRFTLGPYSVNVILPALGHAADQRPTAVTMVMAAPLRELKILVNPALQDTPIGCRAIEIDRFVDETTSKNDRLGGRRKQTREDVTAARALYSLASQQVIEAATVTASDGQKNILNQINARLERPDAALIERGLRLGPSLFDPKQTPLAVKPAYFDKQVVDFMRICIKPGTRPDDYISCVRRQASSTPLSFSGSWSWSAPTPQTDEWSGVRERAYVLDPDLKFAGVGQSDTTAPWPFDFIIQTSFKSPAFALRTSKPWFSDRNSEVDDYVDEQPWLYQEMQADLTAEIIQEIRRNREWSDIYSNLRDYTLLQRLFRVMFSGQLGERFPVDKLSGLAKAVAPLTRSEPTQRWNVRPGMIELEFSSALQAIKEQLNGNSKYSSLTQGIDRCQALMGTGEPSLSRRLDLTRLDQSRWTQACNFEPLYKALFGTEPAAPPPPTMEAPQSPDDQYAKALIIESIRATQARELRHALGVDREDERLLTERRSCGPL
jgi:hypothetical protein